MTKLDENTLLSSDYGKILKKMLKSYDDMLNQRRYPILPEEYRENYIKNLKVYWEASLDALNYFLEKDYKIYRTDTQCGIIDQNKRFLFRIR